MCIYYRKEGLTYNSREHIIPAGLGGKQKLPKGLVSEQFNNDISALEQEFMRDSLIGHFRMITGPGKRGSLALSKQTKGKVHVLYDAEGKSLFGMGYLQQGKPYLIPHTIVNIKTGELQIGFNRIEGIDPLSVRLDLADKLRQQDLRIRTIIDNRLSNDILVLGQETDIEEHFDAFVAKNESNPITVDNVYLNRLCNVIGESNGKPAFERSRVLSKQSAKWDTDYLRLYGKMCFNFLASEMGEDFVQQECFDNVRSWIANGGPYQQYAVMNSEGLQLPNIQWPQDSHIALIIQEENTLFGLCTFYNNLCVQINLTKMFSGNFRQIGIICDWQKHKEYSLDEFIAMEAVKIAREYNYKH